MKRNIIQQLTNWKELKERKVLLLQGARQTGKTYILKIFGKNNFKKSHYFDFMSNAELCKVFENNLDTERILQDLELFINDDIDVTADLIIFDEIQECPRALTSLKYFTQNYPRGFICASGSFFGIVVI